MERREFMRLGGASAAGAALLGCSSEESSGPAVQTRPSIRWRAASSFPQSLDTIYGAIDVLAERVAELSGGKFQIETFQAGELVPGLEVLSSVESGSVQMGHTAGTYYIGRHPALAFDTGVPFGLSARQRNAWFYEGGGLERTREIYANFNIYNLPGGNTGTQMGGWFRQEVNSLEDLQGLKMRIPGQGGEVMSQMGVNTQVLSGGETYSALEQGTIDATEFVGPYDDEKLGFHEVADYYYYPGWWEPGTTLSFLINRDEWDDLPTEYQSILRVAAREANAGMLSSYDWKNAAALSRLLSKGTQLRRFSDPIMQRAREISYDIMEKKAANNSEYKKVYKSWQSAMKEMGRWFASAELSLSVFNAGEIIPDMAERSIS